jgi:3D (Asp-Asp-Asp) domain-containing protein
VHELWSSAGVWHAADPTAAAGAPAAASGSPVKVQINTIANTDEVFYLGTDSHVHELWSSAGVWHAADPTAAAGAPAAVSGSAIAAQINTIANTDEVFYLGTDLHVHELWSSAGVWHAADPTAAAGGPSAVSGSPVAAQINTIATTDEVFYLGTDQHVHQLWYSGGIWHAVDVTAAAGL